MTSARRKPSALATTPKGRELRAVPVCSLSGGDIGRVAYSTETGQPIGTVKGVLHEDDHTSILYSLARGRRQKAHTYDPHDTVGFVKWGAKREGNVR